MINTPTEDLSPDLCTQYISPLGSVAATRDESWAWAQWWPYKSQNKSSFSVMFHQQTFPNNWYILDHSHTHLKLLRNKLSLPFCYRHIATSEHKNKTPKASETLIANNLRQLPSQKKGSAMFIRKLGWYVGPLASPDESNCSTKTSEPSVGRYLPSSRHGPGSVCLSRLPSDAKLEKVYSLSPQRVLVLRRFSILASLQEGIWDHSMKEKKHACSIRSFRNLARKRETFCNLKNLGY